MAFPNKLCFHGLVNNKSYDHGTDLAVMMGLCGEVPATTDVDELPKRVARIEEEKEIWINNQIPVSFDPKRDIILHRDEILPFHPNGM